jgi:hypothetical protein
VNIGQQEIESCDHIVGLVLSSHPEYGGMDGLSRKSEKAVLDEAFRYCPSCGSDLGTSGILTSANINC